jgi:hypothetical protein
MDVVAGNRTWLSVVERIKGTEHGNRADQRQSPGLVLASGGDSYHRLLGNNVGQSYDCRVIFYAHVPHLRH